MTEAMGMITVGELTKMGSDHELLVYKSERALTTLRELKNKVKPIRIDAATHPETELEWLAEFDVVSDTAWAACKVLYEHVRAERHKTIPPKLMMNHVIMILMSVKELIQADTACIMGVVGSGDRWDAALADLRRQSAWVKLS